MTEKKIDPLEAVRLLAVLVEGKRAIQLLFGGASAWSKMKPQKLSSEDVGELLALELETGRTAETYAKDLITIYEDFALDAIRETANIMREWARKNGREDLLTSGREMMERTARQEEQ